MREERGESAAKLAALERRLAEAKQRRDSDAKEEGPSARGMAIGYALRLSVELAAAIGIGTAAGLALDGWLGTAPLFLMVFFFLGCAAGVRLAFRRARELQGLSTEKPPE